MLLPRPVVDVFLPLKLWARVDLPELHVVEVRCERATKAVRPEPVPVAQDHVEATRARTDRVGEELGGTDLQRLELGTDVRVGVLERARQDDPVVDVHQIPVHRRREIPESRGDPDAAVGGRLLLEWRDPERSGDRAVVLGDDLVDGHARHEVGERGVEVDLGQGWRAESRAEGPA